MKKIPIWKNIVLVGATIVILVIATFAWFYSIPRATADAIVVHVGKASYVQISGDQGNNWSDDLEVDVGINKNFKEISGNGTTFFAPVYDVVENPEGGYSPKLVSFEQVGENEYYFEQVLDFRTDTVQSIFLSPESSVTSVGGNSYIDGAIRVAFFELDADGNETLKYIWAPNSTVEFSAENNAFTREGSVESYYYYQKTATPVDVSTLEETTSDIVMISTENTDEAGCGYNETYQFLWSNGANMPENAPSLLTVDAYNEDDKLNYKQLKIRVWLEGHDRECVSLLNGQRFTMQLQFNAEEVE